MRLQHSSLQAQDNANQQDADVRALFGHAVAAGNVLALGTEAGSSRLADSLKAEANRRGWWCYVHGSGEWCAFDLGWASQVAHGWVGPVIPSSSRHSARGVCWVTCRPKGGGGDVSAGVVHLLTAKSLEVEPNPNANKELQAAARQWAVDKGPRSFVTGDVNMSDAKKNVWGGPELTTAWDELGQWPDTHEGGPSYAIDVISRLTSGPYRFTSARAYSDADLKLYSDHKLIEATAQEATT